MFFTFHQTFAGGRFYQIKEVNAELVIIEAETKEQAREIGENKLDMNFSAGCACCGYNWETMMFDEGYDVPTDGIKPINLNGHVYNGGLGGPYSAIIFYANEEMKVVPLLKGR